MLQAVNKAKETAGNVEQAIAKPTHSIVSPKKFAPDTYLKSPPEKNGLHKFTLLKKTFKTN